MELPPFFLSFTFKRKRKKLSRADRETDTQRRPGSAAAAAAAAIDYHRCTHCKPTPPESHRHHPPAPPAHTHTHPPASFPAAKQQLNAFIVNRRDRRVVCVEFFCDAMCAALISGGVLCGAAGERTRAARAKRSVGSETEARTVGLFPARRCRRWSSVVTAQLCWGLFICCSVMDLLVLREYA